MNGTIKERLFKETNCSKILFRKHLKAPFKTNNTQQT